MAAVRRRLDGVAFTPVWGDITGAIGDSVTVLPIVVSVAVVTDLSLATMLVWFGVFQVVWGLYYGDPISVEPMKALAGLLLAGSLTAGEFLVSGLLAGAVLVCVGLTDTLDRLERVVGEPVVRGIQFAVALLLLETGARLALADPALAGGAAAVALGVIVVGYWNLSGLVVLLAGGIVAATRTGLPGVALPSVTAFAHVSGAAVTVDAMEATVAQLAMTVGNAAVATSLLVADFFDREVSPDDLSLSMGAMTLLAVPFGGLPMCHGSGGVAGKYAFGARTPLANLVLGAAYVAVAVAAVSLVVAFPLSMLGVVLVLVALELARASFQVDRYAFVVGIGVLGMLVNVGVAFVVGSALYLLAERRGGLR